MTRYRHTTADVMDALQRAVAADPDRVDDRVRRHLGPRYVEHGRPVCLAAVALADLGVSIAVLRQLDVEPGSSGGGVRLEHSRHPVLRRIEPAARVLLARVQRGQDRGLPWRHALARALD